MFQNHLSLNAMRHKPDLRPCPQITVIWPTVYLAVRVSMTDSKITLSVLRKAKCLLSVAPFSLICRGLEADGEDGNGSSKCQTT